MKQNQMTMFWSPWPIKCNYRRVTKQTHYETFRHLMAESAATDLFHRSFILIHFKLLQREVTKRHKSTATVGGKKTFKLSEAIGQKSLGTTFGLRKATRLSNRY